ncbi:staphylococcal nuclease domain-containing protein 1 [Ixodes scapularis]
MSAPQPQNQAPPAVPMAGIVKQVLSGDTVVIRGQPRGGPPPVRTLYLSNITAPKLAKRPTETISETKDEPFAWEAREFLRKKLVGKEVIFFVEYSVSNRDYGTVYLGKDRSGENVAESLVSEGLVDVRQGGKGESHQRLCDLQEVAKSAGRGKHGPDASSHVRDVKWTLRDNEDPRTFVDRHGRKPIPAVVEHVRDGSTVRVMLLPDFHYITLMLSGIRCPSTRPDESSSGAESPLVEEAKYFTESRLLQRDVEVVLEGATNQNFTGSVLHPNGNIAEGLLKNGFAKCIDWSLTTVTGGSEKLKAAEKEAKEKRLRLWKDYSAPTAGLGADAKFEGKVVEVINADALVVRLEDGELRKIFLSSIRPPRRSEETKASGGESGGKERNFRPLYDIPFMYEAREFLRKKLIGKNVQVGVDYKQPAGNFIGWLTVEGVNLSVALVREGLASVHFTAERSAHFRALQLAEEQAKQRRDRIWAGWEEPSEEAKQAEVVSERKVTYKNVLVTEVKPDLSFYVQFFDDGPKVEEMLTLLRQELTEHPPMPGAYAPKKGDLCAAKFSEDDLWYRAKVEKVSSSGEVDIFFIDYGNRDKTDVSRLAPLPSLGIRDLPPMAREYSLALVALPKDPEQAQEARQAMVQLTAEAALQLNVEYRVGGQDFVTLLVKEGGLDVGKSLLQEGWVLLEERRDRHLQDLVREYAQAQDSAKAKRLNLWCYGDVTEDDSKEFGWGR